ncbi:MAG: S8 family serine peptidase [Blastocatellia bacterium]|nr:S8 family serine peptidase [Blastocatellia bacterium]
MKKIFLLLVVLAVCALAAKFSSEKSQAQSSEPYTAKPADRNAKFELLKSKAERSGSLRVIVRLNTAFKPEGTLKSAERGEQRAKIKQAATIFLNRHGKLRNDENKEFKFIPAIAVEADKADLEELQNDAKVLTIEEDELSKPALTESSLLIGAPTAWSRGFSGAGQAVAVLDTGVDKNHSFLAGKVVSEGCFSSTYAAQSTSLCPGGVESTIEVNSGLNCLPAVSGCSHGTHVAGIIGGRGEGFSGVAKDANIIALQVFSHFATAEECGPGNPFPCVRSFSSDQLQALERVLELSNSMSIAAVNLSLGGGNYTASCDSSRSIYKLAIDNLRSRGIATVVSSGNEGYTGAMSSPACISSAVSVGSTDDGGNGTVEDRISGFSNSVSFLNLLAPGRWIESSIAGGGFSRYSGTSMSAPHAAAAFAVLKQSKPNASVSRMLGALTVSGLPVTDTRNSITKPRIRIAEAITALSKAKAPFDYDGDGKADFTVYRPSDNIWYLLRGQAGYTAMQFGITGDLLAPADYDGDGKSDVAVFRPSTGTWYWHNSGSGTFQTAVWGADGDIPVPADHDYDGKADLIVYRPSNGTWYKRRSGDGTFEITQFGTAEDKPQIGDFDGDGKADLAVFRPSDSTWYFLRSTAGFTAQTWGIAGDIPVPADYDGDFKTDIAVFRPSTGQWFQANGSTTSWGTIGDKPVPADYDGDGKTDLGVFRPSNATWYYIGTTTGIGIKPFGEADDKPSPNAFVY